MQEKYVKMKATDTNKVHEIPFEQAERMLQMRVANWVLADSEYVFDGVLKVKPTTKKDKEKK